MTYRNIYIHPHGALAQARNTHDSRSITAHASSKLLQGGLDDLIAQVISTYQSTGWPKTIGSDSQRIAVWVRPACESYLAALAGKHFVSMPKITLAWMQAAALQLGSAHGTQQETAKLPQQKPESVEDSQSVQPPATVDTAAPHLVATIVAEQPEHARENHPVPTAPVRVLHKLLKFAQTSVKALSKKAANV